MKKYFLISFLFGSAQFIYAEIESKGLFVDYSIKSSVLDKNLKKDQSTFHFEFSVSGIGKPQETIKFSVNGKQYKANTVDGCESSLTVKPGKYRFQFYYNNKHYEIYTDSIEIKPQYKTTIAVNFTNSEFPVICDKPVIYFYPEKAMDVKVKLNIHGEFLFTYPNYENGWEFTALPNGTILMNENEYNYLFWEGKSNFDCSATDIKEGFLVESANLVSFFEEKLTHVGLNSKEIADYITYWVPRMKNGKKHLIRFLLNEEYDKYATIQVQPQPETMIRIFMLWQEVDNTSLPIVSEQALPHFNREGFTMVEWGGTQFSVKETEN